MGENPSPAYCAIQLAGQRVWIGYFEFGSGFLDGRGRLTPKLLPLLVYDLCPYLGRR